MTTTKTPEQLFKYLRDALDPGRRQYHLGQAVDRVKDQISQYVIQRALLEDNPHVEEDTRDKEIATYDEALANLAWQLEKLEGELRLADGLVEKATRQKETSGGGLNRKARRDRDKALTKRLESDGAAEESS